MEAKLRDEDGNVVCERCTLARNPFSRMRGLLGRTGLDQSEGLLLQPSGVRPWRTAAAKRSRAVLELAAGEAARVGLRPGHVLQVEGEG